MSLFSRLTLCAPAEGGESLPLPEPEPEPEPQRQPQQRGVYHPNVNTFFAQICLTHPTLALGLILKGGTPAQADATRPLPGPGNRAPL